jgi:hypothetical protein
MRELRQFFIPFKLEFPEVCIPLLPAEPGIKRGMIIGIAVGTYGRKGKLLGQKKDIIEK